MTELTPMMKQYLDIKKQYPDTILFFRLGDFYETFGEDAKIASKELDIVLTSRSHGEKGEKVPLAGVPYHAIESYLGRLVRKGYKVAICEQLEDPKSVKGLVKRDVVRVVTPGTILESNLLNEKANNYIASILHGEDGGDSFGLALADISTGDFFCTQIQDENKMLTEICRFMPVEIVMHPKIYKSTELREKIRQYADECMVHLLDENSFDREQAYRKLTNHFDTQTLEGFGCEDKPLAYQAAWALISYLKETQKSELKNIDSMRTYSVSEYMTLDPTTLRNLEITKNVKDGCSKGTLIGTLDSTSSAIGSRLLKKWLLQPLLDIEHINDRLDAVSVFYEDSLLRSSVREYLNKLNDIERLINRVNYGLANGRDLIALKESLFIIPKIKSSLNGHEQNSRLLKNLQTQMDELVDITDLIENSIADNPPLSVKDGGIIKSGYDKDLDEIRNVMKNGKDWMVEFERKERIRSGIKSLKVSYNQVFGYYIEVRTPNLKNIPQDYIRKQTLATGERFITPELKEKEEIVLTSGEKSIMMEFDLFNNVRIKIAGESKRIQKTAAAVAMLDVLSSFAEVSRNWDYARPEINNSDSIVIRDGRHPVVERYIIEGFVPNDTVIDCRNNQLLILTGPNMAGKSTYMRQVALIVIMAQIGCFVPAKYSSIGIVDRIFTRVGAFDDLVSGQSTFMVEMVELANILNNSTPRSLIVLDEIGRGTSTFDGLSIACAVVEYLHEQPKTSSKTMFATHYHQLTQLADSMKKLKNYHIAVKEEKGEITFLRKVVPGATDKSYGIHVAKLAGIPQKIVDRANYFLAQLEKEDIVISTCTLKQGKSIMHAPKYTQVVLFDGGVDPLHHEIIKEIQKLDVSTMTPIEALTTLHGLQKKIEKTHKLDDTGSQQKEITEDNSTDEQEDG